MNNLRLLALLIGIFVLSVSIYICIFVLVTNLLDFLLLIDLNILVKHHFLRICWHTENMKCPSLLIALDLKTFALSKKKRF